MQTRTKLSKMQVRSKWLVEMWARKREGGKTISELDCGKGKTPRKSVGTRNKGHESLYKEKGGWDPLACSGVFSRLSWPPTPSPEGHSSLANLALAAFSICRLGTLHLAPLISLCGQAAAGTYRMFLSVLIHR